MSRRRICVITGSRAEYGLLYSVMRGLEEAPDVELQLVVTGTHLAPEFGYTVRAIESDGFPIAERVEMLLASDTGVGIAKSVGLGVIGFADAFARLKPDLLVVLGDRFEIFAAAQAAMFANLPIAHIAGGDTTEGAFDEAIRHSLTKMAQLHLVTNELSARRVVQMGEDPATVHVVGSPGLDQLRHLELLRRDELAQDLGLQFGSWNLLVTFHPVTLEPEDGPRQFAALLDALSDQGPEVGVFFTKPNADTGSRELARMLEHWVACHPNARAFDSLGQLRYLSLMAEVDVVVGNSSSGLYEAPSLMKPAVDIGDRQRGRLAAGSVIRCAATREEINSALAVARNLDCSAVVNPYGDGYSGERIARLLRDADLSKDVLKKRFHDVGH